MTRIVDFLVTNNVTENTGQCVLVFLMPNAGGQHFAAWQTLNPSANGGSQPFIFQDTIQLAVENQETLSKSATIEVAANQLYTVTNENNQGPVLNLTHKNPSSPGATAVFNQTDPAIILNTLWYVNGNPIMSHGGLNANNTVSFEPNWTLFFVVRIPTVTGFNYRLQDFSGETRYSIPRGVNHVDVIWSRPTGIAGPDVLTFYPPSAPITVGHSLSSSRQSSSISETMAESSTEAEVSSGNERTDEKRKSTKGTEKAKVVATKGKVTRAKVTKTAGAGGRVLKEKEEGDDR